MGGTCRVSDYGDDVWLTGPFDTVFGYSVQPIDKLPSDSVFGFSLLHHQYVKQVLVFTVKLSKLSCHSMW